MGREILVVANSENKKYFFNDKFLKLPVEIKNELRILTTTIAEECNITLTIGFKEDYNVYFETISNAATDEVATEMAISKIQTEKVSLIKALNLWYICFVNGKL